MIRKDKQLDLDDAMPGMALADAMLDAHGDVLLPHGLTLTDAALTLLRHRGIDTIVVVNDDVSAEEQATERERLQQRLARLFRRCGVEQENGSLFRHITAYRIGERK